LAFAMVKYFPFGGMQRNLLRIARACAARGHEVHVFAGEWSGPRPQDLPVRVLKTFALSNHGRNERFGRAFRKAVNAIGFDCIVSSNRQPHLDIYYAGDPCRAAKFRKSRPAWFQSLPHYRDYLLQESQVFGKDLDTEILLTAHGEQENFIRYYDTDPARFHLLPPGIDRNRLVQEAPTPERRRALRAELGVGADDIMLLSVGSSFRTKGVDRSIRGLASLPPEVRRRCKLVVVGQGRAVWFALLAHLLGVGDRIQFCGPREDLATFYYSADLLLHPARYENTGNALIEAMVCGLPVLATDNCGYAFHVTRADAGLPCPSPFAQKILNEKLLSMITGQREQWRRGARAYCERVDLYSLVDRASDAIIARAQRTRGDATGD
ncbi:MAG: glycosyltransferase family 4 protein, partial [Planctomycetota bacterium]